PAPAPVPQAATRVIQGSVKLASKQEGIAGVTVTACLGKNGRFTLGRTFADNGVGDELAYVRRGGDVPAGGTIVKNKTFFFALWDGAAGCPTPIQAKTDATGRFQLQDVPPGDYVVRAELEGHF